MNLGTITSSSWDRFHKLFPDAVSWLRAESQIGEATMLLTERRSRGGMVNRGDCGVRWRRRRLAGLIRACRFSVQLGFADDREKAIARGLVPAAW